MISLLTFVSYKIRVKQSYVHFIIISFFLFIEIYVIVWLSIVSLGISIIRHFQWYVFDDSQDNIIVYVFILFFFLGYFYLG